MAAIRLLVGLGNPGAQYRNTRHNAGVWLVDDWLSHFGGQLKKEKKFPGSSAVVNLETDRVQLLVPGTYVNDSGRSVLALASYYRIPAESILIAHDELDLPPGVVRFKSGGGAGGHNGLKDVIRVLGKDFARVRIGIGHPGQTSRVTGYVLSAPDSAEKRLIQAAIESARPSIVQFVLGDRQGAMLRLHTSALRASGIDDQMRSP